MTLVPGAHSDAAASHQRQDPLHEKEPTTMNQNDTPKPSTNETSPAQPPSQEPPEATTDELADGQLDGVAGGISGKILPPKLQPGSESNSHTG